MLDALEQALHERRPVQGGGLVHHSDRGVQYLSIKYTERLAEDFLDRAEEYLAGRGGVASRRWWKFRFGVLRAG